MKRGIFFILCAAVMLCVMAETTRLSRAQLLQADVSQYRIVAPSTFAGAQGKPLTLHQALKERHLTLDDNRLNTRAPRRNSAESLSGVRIASMDVYDFDWDDETGIATVINSSCAISGQRCQISGFTLDGEARLYVNGLFDMDMDIDLNDSFTIPIEYDSYTGAVKLRAGMALDVINFESDAYNPFNPVRLPNREDSSKTVSQYTFTLFAMPLSWLTGDDDYRDIYGQVSSDGSIAFTDEFAFLIKIDCNPQNGTSAVMWALSPIYDNLTLFTPNGYQSSKVELVSTPGLFDLDPSGNGGLSPRPINPRPGNTKPVKPRSFSFVTEEGGPGRSSSAEMENKMKLSASVNRPLSVSGKSNITLSTIGEITVSADVYAYMLDDTTLMVYNLNGMDYCWNYMYVYPDNSVYIPAQPIGCTDEGQILYNCSKDSQTNKLKWGNNGTILQLSELNKQIHWNSMYLTTANGQAEKCLSSNYLFLDEEVPEFDDPVISDMGVMFSASCAGSYEQVCLFVFDELKGEYVEVGNPWYAPRGDEDYMVSLKAQVRHEVGVGAWGNRAYFSFRVPAHESAWILGDVNNDGAVSIEDVTVLINFLLGSGGHTINLTNADVDRSGSLNITDVTVLINYLLTKTWPVGIR